MSPKLAVGLHLGRVAVLVAALIVALIVVGAGCRPDADSREHASSDTQADAPARGEDGTSTAAAGPGADDAAGDPFATFESLRPRPWATWPLENLDIDGYDGWRIDPVHGGFELEHGVLFIAEPGAFVLAIADAEVVELRRVGEHQDALELRLDHGQGIESHYGPLSDALVHAGLPVTRGAAIGLVAGKSLRLRVTVDGLDIDPLLALRQPLHRWPGRLRRLPAPAP